MGGEDLSTIWTAVLCIEILDIHCELRMLHIFWTGYLQILYPSDPHKPHMSKSSESLEKCEESLAKHLCKLVNDFVKMA